MYFSSKCRPKWETFGQLTRIDRHQKLPSQDNYSRFIGLSRSKLLKSPVQSTVVVVHSCTSWTHFSANWFFHEFDFTERCRYTYSSTWTDKRDFFFQQSFGYIFVLEKILVLKLSGPVIALNHSIDI